MNLNGLSFSALPPIDIPFRYFASAPLFVLAMAIFVIFNGEQLWLSRWHPHTILLTHGFTLGFFTMVMMGAILQMLPVVGGVGIAKVRIIGTLCHALHTLGTILLLLAFTYPNSALTVAAIALLASGFLIYLIAVSSVLIKKLSQGATILGMRLAIASLTLAVSLGLLLVARHSGFDILSYDKTLTNIHVILAVGWISLLIISVSFQVVPMFHVTPSFPGWIMKSLPLSLFTLLLFAMMLPESWLSLPLLAKALLILHAVFALALLQRLRQRKRKVSDTTINFWQIAAISLLFITLIMIVPRHWLPLPVQTKLPLLLGAIYGYWFTTSVLLGMLLKILPFLSYTHLQQRCMTNFSAMKHLPNMHELISKKHGQYLFIMHMMTSVCLLITILAPALYPLFGVLLGVEFGWLAILTARTSLKYYRTRKLIEALS